MRFLLTGALALLACACGSSEKLNGTASRVAFEPAVLDFGRVALGTTVEREVTVRNVGRGALSISDMRLDGVGRDMQVVSDGRLVGTGQKSRIRVRYTPAAEEVLERRLEVDVNDPREPTVGVRVTGVALRPRVTVDPVVLDFGRIEVGDRRELAITLRNDFPLAVDVGLAQQGDDQFQTTTGAVEVGARGSLALKVAFVPTRTGAVAGRLDVLPCPTCSVLPVDLSGTGIDRALVIDPEPVNFRSVPIDGHGRRTVTLRNAGTPPLTIHAVEDVTGGKDEEGFTLAAPGLPVTLAEGQTFTFDAHFDASRLGPAEDTFVVRSSSRVRPVRTVLMKGVGGGPEIRVDATLAFGRVPVGARAYARLRISNVGATLPDLEMPDSMFPGAGPGFEIAAGAPRFGLEPQPPGTIVRVPAGGAHELVVWYEPTGEGEDQGLLRIRSNDGSAQPWVEVRLVGRAYVAGICTAEVLPVRIDFGTMNVGQGAALGYRIYNTGPEPCIMRDVDLAPGSDPAFELPGGRIESYVVPPFTSGSQMVAFNPARVGAGAGFYEGELLIHLVNAADPEVRIPLTARSGGGCLLAEPNYLDFGIRRLDCGAQRQSVRYTNVCAAPVDVAAIRLDDESRPGAFRVSSAPGAPFQVGPGASFSVSVTWSPPEVGLDFAAVMVEESGRWGPLLVPMYAEATRNGVIRDRFVQHKPGAVDVLIVMDNSRSMLEEQQRVSDAVGTLITEAQRRGVDYHVAVTTTGIEPVTTVPQCPGGAEGGEAGRFFPVDNTRARIVSATTQDGITVLEDNVHVGLCHHLEQGMEAMKLALSRPLVDAADDARTPLPADGNAGFLRRDASLAVLFVSEEDDRSGALVTTYRDFLNDLKGVGGATVHAIVDVDRTCAAASGVAVRYQELVRATGGTARSICQADFSGIFRDLAGRVYQPRTAFRLSRTPDGTGLTVRVDGRDVPASYYDYDPATREVRFDAGREPPAGADVEISYREACP